jgi:type IV secretion system protein VirD4
MMTTNHLGTPARPQAHPVIASIARELLNKSENERSGVVSTALSLLGLYRDPLIAANTGRSDWRIADVIAARRPVTLYLVVPPSDLSRTRPLARLILNQIARRLTEELPAGRSSRQMLLLLDEFPALGRLDFFESSLAFLGGYGVRAFLVAQSLHQIDRAYGLNHAIVDNCHVRVAFAPNDERTGKRLSDALGTATELREQRNFSGSRLAAWLPHVSVAEQRTPRPLLTPGEILQLPADDALVLISGLPPIRAKKLKYYGDRNFLLRCLPPPAAPAQPKAARPDDWEGRTAGVHGALGRAAAEGAAAQDEVPADIPARALGGDLALLAEEPPPGADGVGNDEGPRGDDDDGVDFPGGVRL